MLVFWAMAGRAPNAQQLAKPRERRPHQHEARGKAPSTKYFSAVSLKLAGGGRRAVAAMM